MAHSYWREHVSQPTKKFGHSLFNSIHFCLLPTSDCLLFLETNKTRMHSSGMRTARLLTISRSIRRRGGGGGRCLPLVSGGVCHTPWADIPLGRHPLPSACWDIHPLPSACWDTPPLPSACWDTHPLPNACWDTHPPPVDRQTPVKT